MIYDGSEFGSGSEEPSTQSLGKLYLMKKIVEASPCGLIPIAPGETQPTNSPAVSTHIDEFECVFSKHLGLNGGVVILVNLNHFE